MASMLILRRQGLDESHQGSGCVARHKYLDEKHPAGTELIEFSALPSHPDRERSFAGAKPIHKATIMPRGNALGMVSMLPEMDDLSMSRAQIHADIDVCMGGRVAEEIVYGQDQVRLR